MCGIVGATAKRDVCRILMEGLLRLEYRGYDSAGISVVNDEQTCIERIRRAGKVNELVDAIQTSTLRGHTGIAHTRWATHGKPTETNAHPHMSGDSIAVVHNGIIENHEQLREELTGKGYQFLSDTDTEVVAHLIDDELKSGDDLLIGFNRAVNRLQGAYALAVIHKEHPNKIVAARVGSPLIIGLGIDENYLASDPQALRPVTDRFIYLEEGEVVELTSDKISIHGLNKASVESRTVLLDTAPDARDKSSFRHFMLKEIYEQPAAIAATLEQRIGNRKVLENAFGVSAGDIFERTQAVQIVACGSSFYTSMIAKYWIEELVRIPCSVEIASEFRYRSVAVPKDTLFVTISQSGETADTLAALTAANHSSYLASLCICNVPNSSVVRGSNLALMIQAGPEIGVASTKAFTAQLTDLLMLAIALGAHKGLSEDMQARLVGELRMLPQQLKKTLEMDAQIKVIAEHFIEKEHALFLGRGMHYPVALEGALKLKEISYIHAEGYPAGELKHGPLALVDSDMPVVAIAPNDELLEKLKSNLQEVKARGGQLFVFADEQADLTEEEDLMVIPVPGGTHSISSPIIYTVPVQLLAYHVAVMKGTDVDQPRNLAKSVTVE